MSRRFPRGGDFVNTFGGHRFFERESSSGLLLQWKTGNVNMQVCRPRHSGSFSVFVGQPLTLGKRFSQRFCSACAAQIAGGRAVYSLLQLVQRLISLHFVVVVRWKSKRELRLSQPGDDGSDGGDGADFAAGGFSTSSTLPAHCVHFLPVTFVSQTRRGGTWVASGCHVGGCQSVGLSAGGTVGRKNVPHKINAHKKMK